MSFFVRWRVRSCHWPIHWSFLLWLQDLSKRWKQYGEESPRFRKRLVSKWEVRFAPCISFSLPASPPPPFYLLFVGASWRGRRLLSRRKMFVVFSPPCIFDLFKPQCCSINTSGNGRMLSISREFGPNSFFFFLLSSLSLQEYLCIFFCSFIYLKKVFLLFVCLITLIP